MRLKKYSFFILTLVCFIASVGTGYSDDAAALDLIHAQGCKGCHKLDTKGGVLGPALDGVGNRLTHLQLRQKLLNPKKSKPDSIMPDYRHLTSTELELITDFLFSLR